jgi:hypothetical protein
MPARELTDLSMRSLPSVPGRQVDVYDSRVRGFGVRVSPNGTKSFFVYYRIGRTARRLTLGRYPNMKLGEARERARTALLAVSDGSDPAVEKKVQRDGYQADLFSSVVDAFIDRYAKIHTRRWQETKRILEREFVAHWPNRLARDISPSDINAIIDGIVDRRSPASAIQALAAVRKLFNWAVRGHSVSVFVWSRKAGSMVRCDTRSTYESGHGWQGSARRRLLDAHVCNWDEALVLRLAQ